MALSHKREEIQPAAPDRLPSGRHGLPREAVVRSQRDRMVDAMVAVVAEKGYTEATVADVIHMAGVSRATFYEQFADKEDCFVAAYSTVMDSMLEHVEQGFASVDSGDWIDQIRAGTRGLLEYFADNPVSVRTGIVEGFSAGTRAGDRYQEALSSFFPFIDAGRELAAEPDRIPGAVSRLIVGGVSALMFSEASSGNAGDLPRLLPEMMYLVAAPYLGQEEALRVMAETADSMAGHGDSGNPDGDPRSGEPGPR